MRDRFSQFRDAMRRTTSPTELPALASDSGPSDVQRPALVIGLGNPGEQYARSRHNVGQWVIRELGRRHRAQLDRQGKIDAATLDLEGRRLHLGRTRGYYNESGGPVAGELRRLNLQPGQLLVVYDELDLPVGQVRIRQAGGHGGNNGMRSIIGALATQEFARIRIGIDRPYDEGRPVREPDRVAAWVLATPGGADREALDAAVARAADAIEAAVRDGVAIAMSRFNPR